MPKAQRQLEEQELDQWIRSLGVELVNKPDDKDGFHDALRDGIVLCRLVNVIRPNSVDDIKTDRSSTSAEDNILHFLQACNGLGIQKIFRLSDLTDKTRDFAPVITTLQELYRIAEGIGMGLSVSEEEDVVLPLSGDDQQVTEVNERDTQDSPELVVRARYAFTGEGEDELVFEKGEIISVTKVVEGGWWEGYCNGRVGWFPGVYVEEIPAGMYYVPPITLMLFNIIIRFTAGFNGGIN
jgi:Rho guanine nucleotide exchange factor 7